MGVLSHQKHEFYCKLRAEGESQSIAYVKAGFKKSSSTAQNASKFDKRPEIIARVLELKKEREAREVESTALTREKAVAMFMGMAALGMKLAQEKRNPAGITAARGALEEAAKLRGLYPEKIPANSIVVNSDAKRGEGGGTATGGKDAPAVVINIVGRDADL